MELLLRHTQTSRGPLWLTLVLAAAGLAVDAILLPSGATCGVPYLALVVLSFYSSKRWAPVAAALAASILAAVPLLGGSLTLPMALDRGMTILAVWAGAGLCLRWRQTQAHSRRAAHFTQSIIDALTSQVAVLDARGAVVAVNDAWRALAADNGPLSGCALGADYLAACRALAGDCSYGEPALVSGVRQVLEGLLPSCEQEYSWGRDPKRWFAVRLSRFEDGLAPWTVVEQEEITARKESELEVERSRAAYRELATRDELTGLFNRRAMGRALEEEVSRHQRYGSRVALIMADIDHFKRVNDEYGHPAGDAVLAWLGRLLAENVRLADKVARYGGEEFAMIAPELGASEGWGMAERLRRIVASRPFCYRRADGSSVEIPITVSFGVAAAPGDAEDAAMLVAVADKALYAAKRRGRNCTVRFHETEDPLVP